MKKMDNNKRAMSIVDNNLSLGGHSYVLMRYVHHDEWDKYITTNMDGIIFVPSGGFDYTRCFSYMFLEDIDLQHGFFTYEATEEILKRGYIEFISLKISAISPFFYVERAVYVPNKEGKNLDIADLEQFKNIRLEQKYTELIESLEKENLWQIDPEQLKKELKGVPLEDYEPEDVTYLSYLFE
ncbi:hypothetical protein [Enterococcus sp. BWR-S5]|uniref:hypothetical protein n=1 Tax=Enterococcus sp. BWR-S5 TaxID=2787714 RepID=UPI001921B43F|nr:hypothetical protein [Enterococcus sp. BWR-S5]MBL1226867.1 hypothetical protein [Enterococcus sp. BWR-S5]